MNWGLFAEIKITLNLEKLLNFAEDNIFFWQNAFYPSKAYLSQN